MEDIKWMSDADILLKIGDKVKELRLARNMSQKKLAEDAGLSLITIQQIEKGNGTSVRSLLRVLRMLDSLNALDYFVREKELSPIEFAEFMKHQKSRQRASRSKNHDTTPERTPFW